MQVREEAGSALLEASQNRETNPRPNRGKQVVLSILSPPRKAVLEIVFEYYLNNKRKPEWPSWPVSPTFLHSVLPELL